MNHKTKKIISKIVFSFVMLFTLAIFAVVPTVCVGTTADSAQISVTTPRTFSEVKDSFLSPSGRLMTMSHRASWRKAPENSVAAVEAAIADGIDIVEIDVKFTSDGHLVVNHDETVDNMTNGSGLISNMTLAEVKALRLKEGSGGSNATLTNHQIPTLREVYEVCKGRALINLDHAKINSGRADAAWDLAVEMGCEDIVIFKSDEASTTVAPWLDSKQNAHANNIRPMFSLMSGATSLTDFNSYYQPFIVEEKIPQMIELVSGSYNTILLTDSVLSQVKGIMRPMFNVMWSSISAEREDTPVGWQDFLSRGVNVLQTDYAEDFAKYTTSMYSDKTAETAIEAEYFESVSSISVVSMVGRKSITLKADSYITFDNVVFDDSITCFNVVAGALSSYSKITLYIDEISDNAKIAEIDIQKTAGISDVGSLAYNSGKLIKSIRGKHKLYIHTDSNVGIESFVFTKTELNIASAKDISVSAYKAIAPNMPQKVSVTLENGMNTNASVKWDYIEPQQYAKSGSFFVIGTVGGTGVTLKANITVKEDMPFLPQQDIITRFSASSLYLNDGDELYAWTNSVSESEDAVTISGQPKYYSKYVNDYAPAVVFDGDDALSFSLDLNEKSELTVIAVNITETSMASTNDNAKLPTGALMYFHESGSWGQMYLGSFTQYATLRFGVGSSSLQVRGFRQQRTFPQGLTAVAGVKNGTTEKLFVDGVLAADTSSQSFISSGGTAEKTTNISTVGFIGKGGNGSHEGYFKGAITEIIIYDRALSDNEVEAACEYFTLKSYENITSLDVFETKIKKGETPEFPTSVRIRLGDGTVKISSVEWGNGDYSTAGKVEVYGIVDGIGLSAKAVVTIVDSENDGNGDTSPDKDGCGSVFDVQSVSIFLGILLSGTTILLLCRKREKRL